MLSVAPVVRRRRATLALAVALVAVVGAWQLMVQPGHGLGGLIGLLYLAAVTPELWRIDAAEHRLPNALVLPGYPLALAGVAVDWVVAGHERWTALLAGAGYFGFLLLLSFAGGMGMGDVKLAGLLGILLGHLGLDAVLVGVVSAFFAGGVVSAVLLATGHGRGRRIPFGPFLLAGFWLGVAAATSLGATR